MKTTNYILYSILIFTLSIAGCKKDEPDDVDQGGGNTTPTCNDGVHSAYTSVTSDACGDGNNTALLDGTRLEYKYDSNSDSLWFLVSVNALTSSQDIGVNVMINIPGGGSTFNFWGNSNTDPYHKLLTFWVTGTAPSNYSGTIGITNAAGVNAQTWTNLFSNNIAPYVDVVNKTIRLGIKRTDLITDVEFPGNSITIKAAAAVGSNTSWNDDIYSSSASITLTKTGCNTSSHPGYTNIVTDPCFDGNNASLLDGTRLEFKFNEVQDSLWFLVSVNSLISTNHLGINIMVNIPSGGSTFNFWGNNNIDAYHKLVTFWATGTAPSNYTGTIGISDAAGVTGQNYTSLSSNNISIYVDVANKTIRLGIKRSDLITDTEFPGASITMKTAAAVGADTAWNDDIYSSTATMTLTKTVAPTVTDIDGNVYPIVTIGTQQWLAADLKTTRYRNGDPIPNLLDSVAWSSTTEGGYGYYNNDPGNNTVYGKLYNRFAITDPRMIAPVGWHIPTKAEFITLMTYLDTALCGGRLKEMGNTHWIAPNAGATNETGFTAVPGGFTRHGNWYGMGEVCFYWTTDVFDANNGVCLFLENYHTHAHFTETGFGNIFGGSIRCIKD